MDDVWALNGETNRFPSAVFAICGPSRLRPREIGGRDARGPRNVTRAECGFSTGSVPAPPWERGVSPAAWQDLHPNRSDRGMLSGVMDPKQIVHSDPEILGGTPVFVGTRVPVDALIDFIESGDTIEDFLENYPGVSREQVFALVHDRNRAAG